MSLTYGLKSPRDMLAKLRRDHVRLNEEVSSDNFFNFVVTAYHIIDWVKNNPSVPASAKNDVGSVYGNTYIAVCRDIANASKHFALDPKYKGQITAKTSAISGFGVGRYGAGGYGVGEESIMVVLNDGQRFDGLQLAQEIINAWDVFFAKHSL